MQNARANSIDALLITRKLGTYRNPSTARSLVELAVSVVPLVLLSLCMWAALERGHFS